MTVLEDLWYGNIRPIENFVDGNMEYKGLLRLASKNREILESELSPKQLEPKGIEPEVRQKNELFRRFSIIRIILHKIRAPK